MVRSAIVLAMCLVAGGINAAGGVGAFHGVPIGRGFYDPRFDCLPRYGCYDPVRLRIELERSRRSQELRDAATPIDPRPAAPSDGPWGPQRYIAPATREADIQPAYRGASRLRPQYEHSKEPDR